MHAEYPLATTSQPPASSTRGAHLVVEDGPVLFRVRAVVGAVLEAPRAVPRPDVVLVHELRAVHHARVVVCSSTTRHGAPEPRRVSGRVGRGRPTVRLVPLLSASARSSDGLTMRCGSCVKISMAPRVTLPLPVNANTNGLNRLGRPPRAMSTPMVSTATLAAASVR